VPRDTRRPDPPLRTGAGLPVPAATDSLGVSREIWISVRTDNQPGDGTLGSPFNGSGGGFDAKMRDLAATNMVTDIVIHLWAGTYATRGNAVWYPRIGWKIRGAGIDVTTLELVDATNYVYSVISPIGLLDTANVEVSDLTVDCNHSLNNSNVASAVALWGSGNAIRRVKVINANAVFPVYENFLLTILAGYTGSNEGNLIEECEVSRCQGTYCSAIGLISGLEPYGARLHQHGAVRRCRVYDLRVTSGPGIGQAYGIAGAWDCVLEDNLAVRCDTAFNLDSGETRNLTIRGNRFLDCRWRGILLNGRNIDNVIIQNNFIEIEPASRGYGIAASDGDGINKLTNFKICNNVIRSVNDRLSTSGGIGLAVRDTETFVVTGNRIDAALRSLFTSEKGGGVL
jgi:hypothetical protein